MRHTFLIYAVSESGSPHLKFKTAHFKQGMPRLKFTRLILCLRHLAAPGRDLFQVWNDSFQARNASFEICAPHS